MEYRLLIDADVLEVMQTLPARRRREMMNHFRRIQDFPGNHEDYLERDSNGRLLGVSVFQGWAVKFWTDFADRHVKVLEMVAADR